MEILTRLPRVMTRPHAALAVFTVLCMASVAVSAIAAEGGSLEYPVKAAYLYKFGIYVEWPNTAFASPTSPLNLCVAGDDPFSGALDAAVNGQRVDSHPIVVKRLKTFTRDAGCHILYLGTTDTARANQILDAARGNGVLTVSDMPGLGVINFVIKDNRVRFNIDEEAAAQNGLGISSKLLSLALGVKPRQSKEGR